MANDNPARRAAIRALLRLIIQAGINGARSMERHVINAGASGKNREMRLNDICAELLCFNMWRACKRAKEKMVPGLYVNFVSAATRGLEVAAAGIFTGLYDAKAQELFRERLRDAFERFDCCPADPTDTQEPLTSQGPIGTASRALAKLAGRDGEDGVILQAFVVVVEAMENSRVNAGIDAVVAAEG